MASVLLSFLYLRDTLAAPIQNGTASRIEVSSSWVNDPSARGTWNILWSCAFTLGLCVWTSVHLNLPSPHYKWWVQWLRKIKWLLIAVVAPEFVVYVAFLQWALAAQFLDSLRERLKRHGKEDECSYFDMAYAHFVLMGGFAVETGHLHNVLQRATVTPRAMLLLASQGHFVHLSKEAIKDKSKASLLGKGLALLQILWLAGQVLERRFASLPVTLLEIHTLVHVVCALIMYILWLPKPLDVVEPSMIQAQDFEGLIAYMLCVTRWKDQYLPGFKFVNVHGLSLYAPEGLSDGCLFEWYGSLEQSPVIVENSTDDKPPWEEGVPQEQENTQVVSHYQRKWLDSSNETHNYTFLGTSNKWSPQSKETKATLLSGQALSSGLGPKLQLKKQARSFWDKQAGTKWFGDWTAGYEISLSQQDLRRLDLAGAFIAKALDGEYPDLEVASWIRGCRTQAEGLPFNAFNDLPNADQPLLRDRQPNCTGDILSDPFPRSSSTSSEGFYKRDVLFLLVLTLIQAAYGGVHLAALGVMFPSQTERLLWKIACYSLLGTSGCVAGFLVLAAWLYLAERGTFSRLRGKIPRFRTRIPLSTAAKKQTPTPVAPLSLAVARPPGRMLSLSREFQKQIARGLGSVLVCVLTIIMFGAPLLFLWSRLYIVIESFISLRRVPVGVYQTPRLNVMGNFPHL